MSIITLNVNGLNATTKRHRLAEWIQKQDPEGSSRVRRGDHLHPHKYIRNTSTCGTAPTEHLLNAGRIPHISQKARISQPTWVGQKKKEKTETKE